jgi:hypothetical protein
MEGKKVSEDGCEDDEEGFWKSFAMSALLIVGLCVEAMDVAVLEAVVLGTARVNVGERGVPCWDSGTLEDPKAERCPC